MSLSSAPAFPALPEGTEWRTSDVFTKRPLVGGALAWRRFALTLLTAIVITAAQLAIVLVSARGGAPLVTRYLSLNQHDSVWYARILERGYELRAFPLEAPGNTMMHIAFFPGFPLAARLVRNILSISSPVALLLTAQLFTVGVWTYVLLFLRRFHASALLQIGTVVAIVSYPSAFYFVAGYSESLFTFSLLGYLYWMTDDRPDAWALAAMHGFLMSATRIVGIPLLALPFAWQWLQTHRITLQPKSLAVAGCAALGAGFFFLYCQSAFGDWNMYTHAQKIGWGVKANFGAYFDPVIYKMMYPAVMRSGALHPDQLSKFTVPLVLLVFLGILIAEFTTMLQGTHDTRRKTRFLLYVATACMYALTVAGLYSVSMRSMNRYALPMVVLLALAFVSLVTENRRHHPAVSLGGWVLLAVLIAVSLSIQVGHVGLFSRGSWVA